MPRRAAPQAPLADIHQEGDTVGKIGFHFERERSAIYERILAREARAVEEHLFSPIHGLVPRESRAADIDEENLSRIGKEIVIESSLCRELRRRDAAFLIGVVSLQVLAAEHPFIPLFRVGGKSRPEAVPAVVAAGIETVRHVRPDLDALHLRQASLGVRLPREQGKRRDDYCDVLSHGQRT